MSWQRARPDCEFCNTTLLPVRSWFNVMSNLGPGTEPRREARKAWQEAADTAEAGRDLAGHGCLIFKGYTKLEGA